MKSLLMQLAASLVGDIGLPGPKSDAGVISNALSAVYFWAGVLAVGLIIFGGFKYTLSNGDASKVKQAKDTILYSLIGLVVVLLAFAITSLVIKGVNGA